MFKCHISWISFQWALRCSVRMDRRTDRRDEVDSRFSKFCERALKQPLFVIFLVLCFLKKNAVCFNSCRSQWPRGLRRRSAAARLLRLWVRIPPVTWIFICCECCMLSGRSLCYELITRLEESYRIWYVVVCDLEISRMRRPWPALGRSAKKKKFKSYSFLKSN
jgi:hypothetical protein